MTFVALSLLMMLSPQSPPPPEVRLVLLDGPDASREAVEETGRILARLQPDYVVIHESGIPASAFEACRRHKTPEVCLSAALSKIGASQGEIVLLAQVEEDALTWLCVGRDQRPFLASRQAVSFGLSSFIPPADDEEALRRASMCLTYGGHQSGW